MPKKLPLDNPDLLIDPPKRGRKPRERNAPTGMTLSDKMAGRAGGLIRQEDEEPVFTSNEITTLQNLAEVASPEDFQKGFAKFIRKLIVRGLEHVPVPRTIKELQALSDMLRKSEGLEAKDKNGGSVGGLVGVRQFRRSPITVVDAESGVGDSSVGYSQVGETGAPDSQVAETTTTTPSEESVDSLEDFEV